MNPEKYQAKKHQDIWGSRIERERKIKREKEKGKEKEKEKYIHQKTTQLN